MAPRPQPYRIGWPITSSQSENIDTMFGDLFKAVRDLSNASTSSTSTAGTTFNLSFTNTGVAKIFSHYANVSNSGTAETDLYSDSLPALTLAADGDSLYISYGGGIQGVATSTQRLRFYVGGTNVLDTNNVAFLNTFAWTGELYLVRESVSVIRVFGECTTSLAPGTTTAGYIRVTGLDLTGAIIVKVTGTAGGASGGSNQITAAAGTCYALVQGATTATTTVGIGKGDLLYGSATNVISMLPDVATGNALISGGVGVAPLWGKIGLTTHVTGILPAANGGTGGDISASSGSTLIGFIQAGTGAVARTAQSKMREVYSVTDFGAVGNDSTNDTTAIQAAIDAAPTDGGVVYFPAGIYKITSKLTLKRGITLRGSGRLSSVIKQYSDVDCLYASGSDSTYITVEDLQLYDGLGIATRSSGHGINFDGSANFCQCILSRLYIIGFENSITLLRCGYSALRDIRAVTPELDCYNLSVASASDVLFDNCGAVTAGRYGYYLTNALYVVFNTCFSDDSTSHGYYLDGCDFVTFNSCSAEENSGNGFNLVSCQKVTLNSCSISKITTQDAIHLDTCRQVSVLSVGIATITGYAVSTVNSCVDLLLISPNISAAGLGNYNADATTLLGTGVLVVYKDANWSLLQAYGQSGVFASYLYNGAASGSSYGLLIDAGGNSSDQSFRVRNRSGASNYFIIRGDGNVGIGTAAPSQPLHVVGNIKTTADLQVSDGFGVTAASGPTRVIEVTTSALVTVNAGLAVTTTAGAVTLPRLTTTQQNAITPVNGMVLYNSTLSKFRGYENSAWHDVITGYDRTSGSIPRYIGMGTGALASYSGSSYGSVGIGYNALNAATTGDNNVGIGPSALATITGNSNCTAVGTNTLMVATGANNTAVGSLALTANTTGYENVGIGTTALTSTTTGFANTAVGVVSFYKLTTGNSNVGVGKFAGYWVNGNNNTAVGVESLWGGIRDDQVVDGTFSVAGLVNWDLGTGWSDGTGYANHGSNGTGILNPGGTSGYRYIDYGVGATYRITYDVVNYTSGTVTVSFGSVSDTARSANGSYTFDVIPTTYPGGLEIVCSNTARLGIDNVTFKLTSDPDASNNTALGEGALYHVSGTLGGDGDSNTAVGNLALRQHTIGYENTAVGSSTLLQNGDGIKNTAIGSYALYTGNSTNGNVGVGWGAGFYETGSSKLFIDNATRSNESDGRAKALVYGVFDAATANQRFRVNGRFGVTEVPTYADNAAATGGGLSVGEFYRITASDHLAVVH